MALLLNMMIVLMPLLAMTNATGTELDAIWDRYAVQQAETETRNAQLDEDANWFQKTWANIEVAVEGAIDTGAAAAGWMWVFVQGVMPFTGNANALAATLSGDANYAEFVIYTGINIFRTSLIALMAFELFLIIRNRKTGA